MRILKDHVAHALVRAASTLVWTLGGRGNSRLAACPESRRQRALLAPARVPARHARVRAPRVAIILAPLLLARADNLCQEGKEAFQEKRYEQAQQLLAECVKKGAESKESAYLLVQTYRERKNYDQGFAFVQGLSGVDAHYVKAFLLFRTGKNRESVAVLGEAFRLDPADWRVHQLFALNYVVLDIGEGALEEFLSAIRFNPSNPELYYQLARFYYSQNRVTESIPAAEKALALSPEYPDAYTNLGLCYEALSRDNDARQSYQKAIALNAKLGRKDEWPFLNYAAFLQRLDDAAASLPLLDQALEQNASSARAYYLRGKALRKLERLAEAKTALEHAITLDDTDPAAYYELAFVLRKLGDAGRAEALLARFRSLSAQKQRR